MLGKWMKTLSAALLGAAFLAAGGPSAEAAPLTATTAPQVKSIPLTQTDWGPSSFAAGVNPLTFNKFDPTLGTLKSVNISFGYETQQDVTLNFVNSSTLTITSNHHSIVLGGPNGSTLINAVVPDYTVSKSHAGPTFPFTHVEPTHSFATTSNPATLTLTDPTSLGLFTKSVGSATVGLPVTATATSTFTSNSGNGSGNVRNHDAAIAVITYTYDPVAVPEPSTIAVVGLGLAGLAIARRQRKIRDAA